MWSVDIDGGRPRVASTRDDSGGCFSVGVELSVHRVRGHMQELSCRRDHRLRPVSAELDPKAPAYDVKTGLVVAVVMPAAGRAGVRVDEAGPQSRCGEGQLPAHAGSGVGVSQLVGTDAADGFSHSTSLRPTVHGRPARP